MDELISRTELLDKAKMEAEGMEEPFKSNFSVLVEWVVDKLPTIPQTYEWCKGCKEYDTENHCCHRYTNFIRYSLQDNIDGVLEDIKAEIKRAIIQSNKDIELSHDWREETYNRGWLGGSLEIVRILEKHYGKIIDDDEIMKESEEEE